MTANRRRPPVKARLASSMQGWTRPWPKGGARVTWRPCRPCGRRSGALSKAWSGRATPPPGADPAGALNATRGLDQLLRLDRPTSAPTLNAGGGPRLRPQRRLIRLIVTAIHLGGIRALASEPAPRSPREERQCHGLRGAAAAPKPASCRAAGVVGQAVARLRATAGPCPPTRGQDAAATYSSSSPGQPHVDQRVSWRTLQIASPRSPVGAREH